MADDKLLKEIRDRWDYCLREWREIREQGRIDMRYVAGDPWDQDERKKRQAAGRPCLAMDELGQYVNQLINEVRQNKRAIKVDPEREGANEKTAELRAGIIREIQYNSKAQTAYTTAFENMAHRSYGFIKVVKKYVSDESDDMELAIERVPNPDTILMDPDGKELDGSDAKYAFEVDYFSKETFKEKWPHADPQAFSRTIMDGIGAGKWLKEDRIQVVGYWRVESGKRRTRLTVQTPAGMLPIYQDELPEGAGVRGDVLVFPGAPPLPIVRRRQIIPKMVKRYDTNGFEILDMTEWEGKSIPLYPFYGKELFVDDGSGAKRVLLSLIRLARDPYMLYCYYRTCQAELVGMAPRTPWVGYEGQFEGHEEEWQSANKVPIAFLQAKAVTDATGSAMLPLPQRQVYEPPIQALEMGAESARRAIQSAVGMGNVSVGKRDPRASSGIALRTLEEQQSQGSFHFIDNYDRNLERIGRDLDEMIPFVYDTASRDVGLRNADESHAMATLNDPNDPDSRTDVGKHAVTISIGPSSTSQRQEAGLFLDTMISNIAQLPLQPQQSAKLLSLAVKMKQLGPTGDEMADIISPPEQEQGDPAQAQQAAQKAQQDLQALNEYAKQLESQLGELKGQAASKQMELDSRERIEGEKLALEREKLALDERIQTGELALKQAQIESEENKLELQKRLEIIEAQMHLEHEDKRAERSHEQSLEMSERSHEQNREMAEVEGEKDNAAKLAGNE